MVSLIYLIFAIATGTLAEFDPTITAAPNTPAAVYSTPPLSPLDPNYVHQDPLASIGENITDTTLEKRSPPVGIYVCDLPDWKGTCAWHAVKDSSCTEFPWKAGISIGPSMGLQCKVYYNKDCAGGERTDGSLTYPGAPNFGVLYSFTKQPAAYRCRTCPNGQTCLNNKAPLWPEAMMKGGYGPGKNGMCSHFDVQMTTYTCVATMAAKGIKSFAS